MFYDSKCTNVGKMCLLCTKPNISPLKFSIFKELMRYMPNFQLKLKMNESLAFLLKYNINVNK